MRNRNCAFFLLNLLLVFAFTACTDYEELLEDDYGYLLIGTEEPWVEESSSDVILSSSSFLRHSESSTECDEEPSSSSDLIASSSGATQSSSSIADAVCYGEYGAEYICVTTKYLNQGMLVANGYGEFVDTRDKKVYKTVTIGTQTWMAQNLNYNSTNSYCYDYDFDNCAKYGRLYLWSASMDSAGVFSSDGEGCGIGKTCSPSGTIRGVCPEGWHLPSSDEWQTLYENVGGTSTAGTKLKSGSGWNSGGNGDDAYGFAVLPAGYRDDNGGFDDVGGGADFWSSTEYVGDYAYFEFFYYLDSHVDESNYSKYSAFSVRCLRNSNGDVASSSSEEESSSSNVIASSSSAKQSSCSEAVAEVKTAGYYKTYCPAGHTCKDAAPSTYLKSGIAYGEILDTRDDQVYKVVTIGDQVWMAQNLNYKTSDSYCYDDLSSSCDEYGRLYTWAAAVDACPSGWHLPSTAEWGALFTNVGGTSSAGTMLKSTSGWYNGRNGEDNYGFAVLPAGDRNYYGYFFSVGYKADFWSSTEYDGDYAYFEGFGCSYSDVYEGGDGKDGALSVRCLRDSN